MFDRFSESARHAVVVAQDEARDLHHRFIGTEHLLLGLLSLSDTTAQVLFDAHVSAADMRHRICLILAGDKRGSSDPLDPEVLALIGIDLDAVRRALEESFGPGALDSRSCSRRGRRHRSRQGHIPFSARSKKVLELAVTQSQRMHHPAVGTEHLLLALLDDGKGVAIRALIEAGVTPARLQSELMASIQRAA